MKNLINESIDLLTKLDSMNDKLDRADKADHHQIHLSAKEAVDQLADKLTAASGKIPSAMFDLLTSTLNGARKAVDDAVAGKEFTKTDRAIQKFLNHTAKGALQIIEKLV